MADPSSAPVSLPIMIWDYAKHPLSIGFGYALSQLQMYFQSKSKEKKYYAAIYEELDDVQRGLRERVIVTRDMLVALEKWEHVVGTPIKIKTPLFDKYYVECALRMTPIEREVFQYIGYQLVKSDNMIDETYDLSIKYSNKPEPSQDAIDFALGLLHLHKISAATYGCVCALNEHKGSVTKKIVADASEDHVKRAREQTADLFKSVEKSAKASVYDTRGIISF